MIINVLIFFHIYANVDNSSFMGGGISISMEEDKNAFKSVALVSNSEFYNNSASSKGGEMVCD